MTVFAPVAAAVCVVAGLAAAPARQQTFRSGVNLVNVPVVVSAKDGALIRGLTRDAFQVTENGVVQTVQFFIEGAADERRPLHVGLLLDVSGSMAPQMTAAATAAIRWVNALDEAQDVTLVDFDEQVRVARFPPDAYPRMFERIRAKKADGLTALYDAVGMFIRSTQDLEGQRVLLLYTDGGDTTSALSFNQLEKLVKQNDVLIYAIGYLGRSGRMSTEAQLLRTLARDTGGEAFFPLDTVDLNEIYAQVLNELQSRYTLGYLSTNPKEDGTYRKIEVKVTAPEAAKAKVRSRPGYFAPGAIR